MNPALRELLSRVQSTADFGYVTFDSVNATNELVTMRSIAYASGMISKQ
jgi:hypothetical protein